ncbi:hypothetical protein LJC06_04285, partial [Bacteroidales bacterium OttesenSCG-928-I14]|nr:hypothetical protein [Bacteroidales bacterium OttesenSCG-928-I14]
LFLLLSIPLFSQSIPNNAYLIQFRMINNKPVQGDCFLRATSASTFTSNTSQPSIGDSDYENCEWLFIPVGNDEPGKYYIRNNGIGGYLYILGSDYVSMTSSLSNASKWYIGKVNTLREYHIYQIAIEHNNKIMYLSRNTNTITVIKAPSNGNENCYIRLHPSQGNNHLFNSDLELIATYEPYPKGGTAPTPTINSKPDFSLPTEGASSFFPLDFEYGTNAKARLLHSNTSTGQENNYYFIRMQSGDYIRKPIDNLSINETTYLSLKMRLRTTRPGASVGVARIRDDMNSILDEKPIRTNLVNDENLLFHDPDAWNECEVFFEIDFFTDGFIEIESFLEEGELFDLDEISLEELSSIPSDNVPFKFGKVDNNGYFMYDYPFHKDDFTFSIRHQSYKQTKEDDFILIPLKIFDPSASFRLSLINADNITYNNEIDNCELTEDGIRLDFNSIKKNQGIENTLYELSLTINCSEGEFTYPIHLKVVPDTLYWQSSNNSNSWYNEDNWKDKDGNSSFLPLKTTNIVLTKESDISLNIQRSPWNQDSSQYIAYEYPSAYPSCSKIILEEDALLGNQFYLDYDSAEINLKFNTLKWHTATAPLKGMYSGDFRFDYANPITQMRLHNTISPDNGLIYSDWTKPFSSTTVPLGTSEGFSFRIGKVYYSETDENGVDLSSRTLIDSATLKFPQRHESFTFHDEITKKPLDYVEYLPENARKFSHRFIYEIINGNECKPATGEVISSINFSNPPPNSYILIGNPFMAYLDFKTFYSENSNLISNEFKLYIDEEFITYSGYLNPITEQMEWGISVDNILEDALIPPLSSFIVKVKDNPSENSLVFTKAMNKTPNTAKLERNNNLNKVNLLQIEYEQNNETSKCLIHVSPNYSEQYLPEEDAVKMDIKEEKAKPSVFTVSDNRFLEVNRSPEINTSIGILSSETGFGKIKIRGLSSFTDKKDLYFIDKDEDIEMPLFEKETFEYSFDNNSKNILNRFFIRQQKVNISNTNKTNIKIYTFENSIHINSLETDNNMIVKIFSIDGKLLLYKSLASNNTTIDIPKAFPRIIIINIRTPSLNETRKVVLK